MKNSVMAIFAFALSLAMSGFATSDVRETVDLDVGWRSICTTEGGKRFVLDDVELPHNWNDYWGLRRYRHSCLHGKAVYERSLDVFKPSGKRACLVFEGVGQYLTVEVNGKTLVSHRPAGKVTTTVDVTGALSADGHNLLRVTCEHPAGIVDMPWVCGGCSTAAGFCECPEPVGLFRRVRLVVTDEVRIAPFGIHVWGIEPFAEANVEIEVVNGGTTEAERTVRVACAALGVGMAERVSLAAGETRIVKLTSPLRNVRRWSAEQPNLYRFDVTLEGGEGDHSARDADSVETGFRAIGWPFLRKDGDGRFLVNGKPVFVHGVCDADVRFGSNAAFGPEEIGARTRLIRDVLGFNAVRDGHEPHDLQWGRAWDRKGVYWWPQFGTHVYYDNPDFRRNYLTLLEQWVKERRNSPSAVIWGIQNESVIDPGFMREIVGTVRRLDPTSSPTGRLCATCNYGEGADWTVVQNWSGTYGGDLSRYGEELSGKTQLLNGEYGAYRCAGFHGKLPEKFDPNGPWTEEHAAYILHQKLMQAWAKRDRICGQFQWLLFSHENPGRCGPDDGYRLIDKAGPVNHKGLLTLWGAPTEAFYAYAAYGKLLRAGQLDAWMNRPVEEMIAEGHRLLDPPPCSERLSLAGDPARRYLYRLNCGGDAVTDSCGQSWLADSTGFTDSWAAAPEFAEPQLNPVLCSQGVVAEGVLNAQTADQPILSSYRWGRNRLRFNFSVAPSEKYVVEAWFAEPGGYGRMFDIAVNGRTVESRLDLPSVAGDRKAVKRTWRVVSDAAGRLVLSFPRVQVSQAVISAIAVSAAPDVAVRTNVVVPKGYPASDGLTWRELCARVVERTSEGDQPQADDRARLPVAAIQPIVRSHCSLFVLGLSNEYTMRFKVKNGEKGPSVVTWMVLAASDKRLIAQGDFKTSGKPGEEIIDVPIGSFVNAGSYFIHAMSYETDDVKVTDLL